jgi:hypothetical protein
MMQMVRKNAPDSAQAATRLSDALMKMTAPDAVKNFKKFGVDIKQVMTDARNKGINPMEAAVAELQRVTGGDVFKLSQIFGDKEAKLALMSLMKYRKEYDRLKADAGGSAAAGTVDRDYQRSLQTFAGTLASFQNSAQRLGITVGNALLPPLTSLAEKITPIVEGIANWASANPALAKSVVVVGAVLAGLTVALPVIAGVVAAVGVLGGPVTAAVLGIGYAIGMVVAHWGTIKTAAASVFQGVTSLWGSFGTWIGNVFNQAVGIIRAWGPRVLGVMFPIPGMIIRLFTGSNIGQRIITSIIDGLKARFSTLVGWVRGAWSNISGIFGGGTQAAPAAGQPATPPGRAAGGSVRAGQPYVVGERRRELFVPGMDGAIIPRIARPVTGGGGVTIHAPVTIHAGGGDAMTIRDQVRMAFEDLIARAYGDYRVALND